MAIAHGWTPLSGPKVPAEATHPSRLTSPLPQIPKPPIPSTKDDGFSSQECCGPSTGGCGCACGGSYAVNVASGALLYRYEIPENTIPIYLTYESDIAGVSELGSSGWMANFHRKLNKSGTVVTVTCSDGCNVGYTRSAANTFMYIPSSGIDNLVQASSLDSNIYTETLPNGLQYQYDFQGGSSGRIKNILDPDGRKWTFNYSGTNRSTIENHLVRRMTVVYNAGGTKIAAIEDTAGRRTSINYDASGKLGWITGPQGCLTSFEYTGVRVNRIIDPDNYHSLISYESLTSKVAAVVALDPDAAKNQITTFTYPSATTAKVTNPKNDPTTYSFDVSNRLTKIENAEAEVTTYQWDSSSRVTMVVNARSIPTNYTWEAVTSYFDDTRKRLKAVAVDPASTNQRTSLSYSNNTYELIAAEDPLSHRTTYTYLSRHLRTLKNAKGEVTTWNYSSNVLSSIQDARTNRTSFTFGGNGMVSQIEDAKNRL